MLLPHLTAEIHCGAFPGSRACSNPSRPVINVDAQGRALLDLPDILSQTAAV